MAEHLLRCDDPDAILSIYLNPESRKLPAERLRILVSLMDEISLERLDFWERRWENVCERIATDVSCLLDSNPADRDAERGLKMLDSMISDGPQLSRAKVRDLRKDIRTRFGK